MDKETYELTQAMIISLVRQTTMLPLAEFLNAIEQAETLGPIIDPTLYRDYLYKGGKENLDLLKQFAEQLLKIKNLAAQANKDTSPLAETVQ